MSHKDVKQQKSIVSIIISTSIILLGVLCYIVSFKYSNAIGAILIFGGILSFLFAKKDRIYTPSGAKIVTRLFYYNPIDKSKLTQILENKDFNSLKSIKQTETGVQMEVFMSKDNKFAAVQLYDYVPHRYVESSPLFEYVGEDALNLSCAM